MWEIITSRPTIWEMLEEIRKQKDCDVVGNSDLHTQK